MIPELPWWAGPGQLPIPVRFEPPAGSVHAEHAAALRREWEQQDVEAREHAERMLARALAAHNRDGGVSIAERQEAS